MQCENAFCVYWYQGECSLREISLDIQGSCECCIYVDIDERILDRKRKRFLLKNNLCETDENKNKAK